MDQQGKGAKVPVRRPSVRGAGAVRPEHEAMGRAARASQVGREASSSPQPERGARAARPDREAQVSAEKRGMRAASGRRTSRPARKRQRWPWVVASAVVALVLAVAVAFACWRWVVCDDARDFEGTWYVPGSSVPIEVENGAIRLSDEVSYDYALDAGAKTVSLEFGPLSGEAHYRFSLDRQTLAIADGTASGVGTLLDDVGWTAGALVKLAQEEQASPALGGDDALLLVRDPAAAIA